MANIYVRSTDGANADNGTTWALANLDLGGTSGATTDAVAGDTIFVSPAHAESTTGAPIITLPGTPAAPIKIICADDAAEPPTAVATTATVTSTSNLTINGSGYFYGIAFRPGSGGSVTQSFLSGTSGSNANQVYDNCSFQVLTTGAGLAKITFGDDTRTDSNTWTLKDTSFKFGGVNQRVKVAGRFHQYGGSILSGSAVPVNLYEAGLRGIGEWLVVGADYSANAGSAFNLLLQNSGGHAFTARFYAIKFPTSWTGRPWSAKPTAPGMRVEIFDSLIGTSRLRAWVEDYAGDSRDDVTVYRDGGFADDADSVNFSIKMVSSANASYPAIGHRGVPVTISVATSGSPVTKYLEIVHDSQGAGAGGALTNAQITVEVVGPSGYASNVKATFLATAADHATSSETWTGTGGMAAPVKQRMAITFTPPRKGRYEILPVIYAASKTVYYCLKAT